MAGRDVSALLKEVVAVPSIKDETEVGVVGEDVHDISTDTIYYRLRI